MDLHINTQRKLLYKQILYLKHYNDYILRYSVVIVG